MKSAKKYYAYLVPSTGARGVCAAWPECEKKVKGVEGARYRGFKTKEDAAQWLASGAGYETRVKAKLAPGIYFDAGTGRGEGVEISVTDERGANVLHKALARVRINRFGKHAVRGGVTNNYGELLACNYALKIALKTGARQVFGDSRLVIEHWSKGHAKKNEIAPATMRLVRAVARMRKEFEASGGAVRRVSGDDNPADLGFHR